jgi:hypothetical protein
MSNIKSNGGLAYSRQQRSALAVASVRLRLIRRFSSPTARELADALVACARAGIPVAEVVDMIDVLFHEERIPASQVGHAYRLAQMIANEGDHHAD